jgi:hypothetical protein
LARINYPGAAPPIIIRIRTIALPRSLMPEIARHLARQVQRIASFPKVRVSADGRGVCSHVGSRLLAEVAAAAGVGEAFEEVVGARRQRRSAHAPGRVLADLAVMLADGGVAIGDLAVLRDQPDLFGPVASTATAWRVLDGVDEPLLDLVCPAFPDG